MQYKFAENVDALQPSAIREILKFTSMPGVISFAAGSRQNYSRRIRSWRCSTTSQKDIRNSVTC